MTVVRRILQIWLIGECWGRGNQFKATNIATEKYEFGLGFDVAGARIYNQRTPNRTFRS